jgi:hypothetical protein
VISDKRLYIRFSYNSPAHYFGEKRSVMIKRESLGKIALFATEPPQDLQVCPEVLETRRRLLWLPASFFAASFFGLPEKISANIDPSAAQAGDMSWDEFLKQCVPVSRELHKDSSSKGQDAYLYRIASMAARISPNSIPKATLGSFAGLNPPVDFGISHRGVPFFVVEWRMAPNAVLPPHCHPNASVCTLGIEGETRIRNFQIVGPAPEFSSSQSFHLRETHNEIIAPGRINTLSSTRDNIHTFHAGKEGARGIDISTYHGPDVGFSFLDIRDTPVDPGRRVYEATWKKL